MPVKPAPRDPPRDGTIIMIPARLASSRLPDKPLALIGGVPMIVQVWRRACETAIGPVVVACAEAAIAEAVAAHGGEAVLTEPALPSGTDRIFEALSKLDPKRRFRRVINLQGDLPTLDPAAIRATLAPIERLGTEMGTLVVPTEDPADKANPNVVKAVVSFEAGQPRLGRALYFTRAGLPASPLERRERLEQLRALEAGMSIGAAVVDTLPLGVDTPADLERARALFAANGPPA
jgi:3-deoxy-manno-octulosonate cytidylyltransferase (CMP-KDO synthetase)